MGCNNSTLANGKVDGQQQQPPIAEPLAKSKEEHQQPPKAEPLSKGTEEQHAIIASTASDMKTSFKVTVEKATNNEKLGMTLLYPEKNALYVKKIDEEGAIPTYNSANVNTLDVLVREGDSIVEVNGVSGDTDKMMEELGAKTKFVLAVQRGKITTDVAPTLDTATLAPIAEQVEPGTESNPQVEVLTLAEGANAVEDAKASTTAPANTLVETASVEVPVEASTSAEMAPVDVPVEAIHLKGNSLDGAILGATSTSEQVYLGVDETEIAVAPHAGEMEEAPRENKPCGGWCF